MKTANFMLCMVLMVFAGSVLAGERVDQRVSVPAEGTISINNVAGSVRVSAWDRSEVRVEGELDDRVERLEFENDGSFTRVHVIYPRNMRGNVSGSELNISVPAGSRLEISTVSASADVRGVTGAIRVGTVSGDVTLDEGSNEYALETVSGNVRLNGTKPDARVKAGSVSGNLRLGGVNGELDAASVSGDVSVSGGRLTRAEIGNTSGDIDMSAAFSNSGTFRFKSISGDVTLRFTGAPAGIFDITSFSGSIDNDFGPAPQRTSRYAPGTELKFREGDADAEFRVNTLSGDISLRKD